jgi:hypothetical protein
MQEVEMSGAKIVMPIEKFSEDEVRLLEIAEKLPKLSRKISL